MIHLTSFVAGLVFAVGLAVGGMTRPGKVVGFLDFTGGAWDPSLAFVMAGGLVVYGVALRLMTGKREKPVLGARFQIPTRRDVTPRLVVGASLFGVGWALAGFCPGPALAAAGSGSLQALLFLPAMVGGMALFRAWDRWSQQRAVPAPVVAATSTPNPVRRSDAA
jgi:uncharacterized protein